MYREEEAREVREWDPVRRDRQRKGQELAKRIRDEQKHEWYDRRRRRTEVEEYIEGTVGVIISCISLHSTTPKKIRKRKTDLLVIHNNNPTNHILIVIAGISGSSIFDTDARTSGNGLSSSSIASKSNSILESESERVSVKFIGWSFLEEECVQVEVDAMAGGW